MKPSLSGVEVGELWNRAYELVQKGDYSAARLVIEKSLVSEVKALEKQIEKREQRLNAQGVTPLPVAAASPTRN